MRRHTITGSIVAPLLVLAFANAAAAQPRVVNGRVENRPAAGGLAAAVRAIAGSASDPAWIAYGVPSPPGDHQMCCGDNGNWGRCGLEPEDGSTRISGSASSTGPIHLEGARTVLILQRVADKTVQRIRMVSPDCELDAGGLTVYWLEGVSSADSISYLSTFVSDNATRRLSSSALAAIAMHGDPGAVSTLIRFARDNAESKVRGDALFWLAQRAGERAAQEITAAIERDPDTQVKKRAVFALSQLPKDEGVPLLIQTAKTNRNPAVRKQAMFWLGQSNDPRALAFFEEILGK
jgi:HEAT repeat protein